MKNAGSRAKKAMRSPELFDAPNTDLIISESASLIEAIRRLNQCEAGFTVFCANESEEITGVISRGDVLRFLERRGSRRTLASARFLVRDAMTPHRPGASGPGYMLFVRQEGDRSWYEQITTIRDDNWDRWIRIKLLPVLNHEERLVNVLDLESPRTRARLEIVVMAAAFSLAIPEGGIITDAAIAERRRRFDSIHYRTHWKKVRGLCDLLLQEVGGNYPMQIDVFNRARADEIVGGLYRYEEWLRGHLSVATLTAEEQGPLRQRILKARERLVRQYAAAQAAACFPPGEEEVTRRPEIIVVLGCRAPAELHKRVAGCLSLIKQLDPSSESPIVVFSGGGDGQQLSEAERMCRAVTQIDPAVDIQARLNEHRSFDLTIRGRRVHVLLEEDSLDTLGNAVFSWLTLKLRQNRIGLTSKPMEHRLKRLVLVTDGLHAPRSHDLFRRIFAFQNDGALYDGPEVAVKTVAHEGESETRALEHLRSEAQANSEIFRLVNPLTNGYDVIANGHVRSVLGQMIRLHSFYKNRWDLVRKYEQCWADVDEELKRGES